MLENIGQFIGLGILVFIVYLLVEEQVVKHKK
jgi:hypothetical protein